MLFTNKKHIKMIAVAVAAVFLLGIGALAVTTTGTGYAAKAGASSNIGKVNMQVLMTSHPDYAKAQETMKQESEQANKDFQEKTATMSNEQEKQKYGQQLQQRLEMKEKELITALQDKINAAIKEVAEAKGLTVVLPQQAVIFGGQDITDDVVKKFKK